ncbi:MAG: formyltransferase family protein [Halothiobacillaceae bacterium]|nr:formyltransferase family protein [Halothiobacillaceae bacterium]
MQLRDIGMVAGDTSRSRAYLQALARNGLLPGFVLVLESATDTTLPGQLDSSRQPQSTQVAIEADECWSEAHFDPGLPIRALLDELAVPYEVLANKDINAPAVVEAIRHRTEQVFIYSGFGGALLRKEVLSAGKRFLHVHGGYLPDYKGSTTNYYSLIVEGTIGASAIFLNEEIDCGPVLQRRKFPPPANRQAIDYIYDSGARAKVLVETLRRYQASGDWEFELPDNVGGETYYIIHPVLKHLAILAQEKGGTCE